MVKGKGATFGAPIRLTQSSDRDELAVSVVRDRLGKVHLGYLDRTKIPSKPGKFDYNVRYARLENDTLVASEEVATSVATFPGDPPVSIAVAPNGDVHLIFPRTNMTGGTGVNEVWHRRRSASGAWDPETLASANDEEATGAAIVADSTSTLHMVWAQGVSNRPILHRSWSSSGWGDIDAVTQGSDDRAYYLGLGIDRCDALHIAFRRMTDGANADVFYAYGRPGAFTVSPITQSQGVDEAVAALAVSTQGNVAIAFAQPQTLPAFDVQLALRVGVLPK
jgi:hypothetical protein